MDQYVRNLFDQEFLGAEEERDLATRAASGDRAARAELICASLRLVAMRARMLHFSENDLADAVQAGTIGLIKAVDRFDPGRGVRLKTWAWWWIGDAMRAAVPPAKEQPVGSSWDLPDSW